MNSTFLPALVYCFGEVLWDILPDGPQPGGAPFNVAYHLSKLKIPAGLISRVGHDRKGRELIDLMNLWRIKNDLVQADPTHHTSRVLAQVNDHNEVTYDIVFPVAWDFIEMNDAILAAVKNADYFVYGSLAARHVTSKETLFCLLDHAKLKVFDVNLRPPFYKKELLELLLAKANLLKVNKSELETIQQLFDRKFVTEEEQIGFIQNKFYIPDIIVTKGVHGASCYSGDKLYHTNGVATEVCDSIGSGDAFLAAFIASHSRHEDPEVILKKSVAMGAFIAGKKGRGPEYQLSEYLEFYKSRL